MACGAGLSVSSEPDANSFSVNSRALTPAIFSKRGKISRSRGVVVGDVRFSVSETSPASSRPAIGFGNSTFCRKKQSATIVLVEPTGSLRNKIGCCVVSAPSR